MWEFKISEVSFLTGLALCKNLGKNIRIYKIIPFFHKLIGCGSTTIMYGLFIAQERVLLTSKPQATTVKTYGRNWKQKCKLLCVLQFFSIITIWISLVFVCLIWVLGPKDLQTELEGKMQIIRHFTILD